MKTTLEELRPTIRKASWLKLSFTFNAAIPLKAEIEGRGVRCRHHQRAHHRRPRQAGQAGRRDARRCTRSGAGLTRQARRPKPDISTTEAFKRALLDAKSICYVEQGATGIYLKGLFERLDIAEQLKARQTASAFQSCRAYRGGTDEGRNRH